MIRKPRTAPLATCRHRSVSERASVAKAVLIVTLCVAAVAPGVGCRFAEELLHMKAPEVRSHTPDSRFVVAESGSEVPYISVRFTNQMDREATERAFELTRDRRPLPGRFSWKGRSMRFRPDLPVTPGGLYRFSVSTVAQDRYGNALNGAFSFEFRTGTDDRPPLITQHSPEVGAEHVGRRESIRIRFSEPVTRESFLRAFEISPRVAGGLVWEEDDAAVTFAPAEPYQVNSGHRVSIGTELTDRSGNRLAAPLEFHFHTGPLETLAATAVVVMGSERQLEPVEVLWSNTGIESNDIFKVSFNRPVTIEERESVLRVSPRREFRLSWDSVGSRAVLEFPSGLLRDEYYHLSFPQDTYRIAVDGPRTRSPAIREVRFNPNLDAEGSQFVKLRLNDIIALQESSAAAFEFDIAHAIDSVLEPGRFLEQFSVASSSAAVSVRIRSIHLRTAEAPDQSYRLTTVHLAASTVPHPVSGTLTLRLSDRFADSAGNRKASPFAVSLNY